MVSSECNNKITLEFNAPYSGVATITLNKPELHNAFDEQDIASLIAYLNEISQRSDIRLLCLQATGKSFCAGADLNWMKRMSQFSEKQNQEDASQLSLLMHTLATLPQPTLAIVQGNAFGGGVGLIACCDIVVASNFAQFCLSEVKLGLIPAVISPYLVAAIGMRQAKRFMLTAEIISTEEALRLGLIHKIASSENLDFVREEIIKNLLSKGPQALREVKLCCQEIANSVDEAELQQNLAKKIAKIRVSEEAQEGIKAFFNKIKAKWSHHV